MQTSHPKTTHQIMTVEKNSEYFCSATYSKHLLKMKTKALICTKIKSEMSQPESFVKTKCHIYNDHTFHLSTTEP